jgi:hypothetical protein
MVEKISATPNAGTNLDLFQKKHFRRRGERIGGAGYAHRKDIFFELV